jgi:hypothetical protein
MNAIRTPVIMPAIMIRGTKNRVVKGAAIEVGRTAAREEHCLKGCGFSTVWNGAVKFRCG